MKKIFIAAVLCLLFVAGACEGFAQQSVVEFRYDDTGNRILRHVIELPPENNRETQQNRETSDTALMKYSETIGRTEINIYPNPNGGRFTVVINNPERGSRASLALYSVSGALLLQRDQIDAVSEIDIRNRENGSYILRIEINGKQKTWKVIKQ